MRAPQASDQKMTKITKNADRTPSQEHFWRSSRSDSWQGWGQSGINRDLGFSSPFLSAVGIPAGAEHPSGCSGGCQCCHRPPPRARLPALHPLPWTKHTVRAAGMRGQPSPWQPRATNRDFSPLELPAGAGGAPQGTTNGPWHGEGVGCGSGPVPAVPQRPFVLPVKLLPPLNWSVTCWGMGKIKVIKYL